MTIINVLAALPCINQSQFGSHLMSYDLSIRSVQASNKQILLTVTVSSTAKCVCIFEVDPHFVKLPTRSWTKIPFCERSLKGVSGE